MAIDLDVSQWPFVFTRFDGEQTTDELEIYIQRMNAVHARKEPYVGVSYLKRYTRDQAVLDRISRWVKETEQVTRQYCLAVSMINSSTGFRFILSAIFLVKPMPCPYHVCGSFDDAVGFVRREAEKRRLRLPAARSPWPDSP